MEEVTKNNIIRVENLYYNNSKPSGKEFKIINKECYIANSKWPFQLIGKIRKFSEIIPFPFLNIKVIINFTKEVLRGKINTTKIKHFLGLVLLWPSYRKIRLFIHSDLIYLKRGFTILINEQEKIVIKYNDNLNQFAFDSMQREYSSQLIANNIIDDYITTPKIISQHSLDNLFSYSQEFIIGKNLHIYDNATIELTYKKIFDFLYKFYKQNGIQLVSHKDNEFLFHEHVEKFLIQHFPKFRSLIYRFNEIDQKNKLMFYGKVHGDLSLNNVIIDSHGNIYLIDWGKSKPHYLANDLKCSNYDANDLFNRMINENKINYMDIYSLKEQIFIERFIEINRLTYNRIKRGYKNQDYFNLIDTIINNLTSLEIK